MDDADRFFIVVLFCISIFSNAAFHANIANDVDMLIEQNKVMIENDLIND